MNQIDKQTLTNYVEGRYRELRQNIKEKSVPGFYDNSKELLCLNMQLQEIIRIAFAFDIKLKED